MESIQDQISILSHKVDSIYQILDRLDREVFQLLGQQAKTEAEVSFHHLFNGHNDRYNGNGHSNGNNHHDRHSSNHYSDRDRDWIITQQDILIDSTGMEINQHQIKEQDLSPQVQIQRLTAQLTAAYNRIAALEEQLLAKRWH